YRLSIYEPPQVVGQTSGCAVAIARLLQQALAAYRSQVGGNLLRQRRETPGDCVRSVFSGGPLAGQQFIQNYSERKNIAGHADVFPPSRGLLRRRIGGRT